MDLEEFRLILVNSGVDVWTFIDTAITVACLDYETELKDRRDLIVERLYASVAPRCRNCDLDDHRHKKVSESEHEHEAKGGGSGSPLTPQSIDKNNDDDDDDDDDAEHENDRSYGPSIDDEKKKIVIIKEHLEDPDQSEDSLVDLLQSLADMDITFKALKETDIGRHVNRLRKHSSSDVRRLVKQLVRKWKDLVDEWVKLNTPGELASSSLIADGDSPQQNLTKTPQNGHHQVQVPDFAYSPNPHNGSSGSDKNNAEPEVKGKAVPKREAPTKPAQSVSVSVSATIAPNVQRQREQKETIIDPERLASARKRLHENYQEAQNAKKQRTIQVMDIHEIPKPKNAFFGKNKGSHQGRHW